MKGVDLNLLVIFDAIMEENSITLAAERLSLTQPSVSNAVSRMRHVWGDPLFVKKGRGITPTPMAMELWEKISPSLRNIQSAVDKRTFDPSTSQRTFRIALTDFFLDILWVPLWQHICKHAPNINLYSIPCTTSVEELLLPAKVDLVIDVSRSLDKRIRSQKLFDNHYVCALGNHHELANKRITLKRFIEQKHLLMSLTGDVNGVVDRILANQGLRRRVACSVNQFSAVPKMLLSSNLITVIPKLALLQSPAVNGLVMKDMPLTIHPAPVSIIWHQRSDFDPGVLWLMDRVVEIIEERVQLSSQHSL